MKVLVSQSCPTLCDPVDCSSSGLSVHGILQARILEWVAIPFPRGSSWPRDQTHVSCIGRWSLYHWATREALPPAIILRPTEFWRLHWVFSLLLDSSWSRCKLSKLDLAILLVLPFLPSLDNFPSTEEDQEPKIRDSFLLRLTALFKVFSASWAFQAEGENLSPC